MRNNRINKVLVVDDIELNYKLIERILRDQPYQLIYAKSGKAAIDICMTRAVDLVLMDLKMPDMNGFEASTRIKEFKPNLPIILQTAYAKELSDDVIIMSLVDAIISKPIIAKELKSKINWYLKVGKVIAC